jgi:predicted nucleotidyltransferase
LLDFSRRSELGLHAAVIAKVQAAAAALAVEPLIVGAFARDLHLTFAHGIPVLRQTEDVDLAIAIRDWAMFDELRAGLLASGSFEESPVAHRLRHGAIPIDLVPFGGVETADRTIAWPPRGEVVMDVLGFQEAEHVALDIRLPGDVQGRVVTLPALALLKLVCWQDRHLRSPTKDASDLQLIMTNYLQAGNEHRMWDEFLQWTQEDDFDYAAAGARMLGHDIGLLLDVAGRGRIARLISAQSTEERPGTLTLEMNQAEPERPRRLLAAMLYGLSETGY